MTENGNEHDGRSDFDFLFGRWKGHNRRLRERLAGCTEWEEFDSILEARPILAGAANIDELLMHRANGPLRGGTLRLYDLEAHEWSLYWADGVHANVVPPQIGKFVNGRGEFYAQDTHAGRHVYTRFIWSDITQNTCHWEQAFSADGGRTWETNWTMDYTRID